MSAKHGWRVAVVLMVVGILVCLAALASAGFDFSRLSTGTYETRTVPVSEEFRSITVTGGTERIVFAPSADGGCSVVFRERENEPLTVTVEDGILTIENTWRKAWHFFDFSFFTEHPSITVYLPGTAYQALSVSSDTGDVEIPADFAFDSIQVHVSTGDVRCGASATGKVIIQASTGAVSLAEMSAGEIRLKTSTGGIRVKSVTCAGEMNVHVSTGGAALEDVTCGSLVSTGSTGGLALTRVTASGAFRLERSTGSVRFDHCDADTLTVKTDTGSVTGTLLSEKIFIAHSDTGRVEVPNTTNGGRCEISTDTGGIRISITDN